jgi:hypothetical protein
MNRNVVIPPPLVAACITGGTIHVSISKPPEGGFVVSQDVFRLTAS